MLQNNKILTIFLLISIYYTTIVYSVFDTRLQIEGDAVVRTDQNIRITNLEITNTVNDAYEEYNFKYGKDTTSMYLILPANSSITYTVEITNKVSDSYLIDSIEEISNTNNNVGVDLSLNINDVVNSNSTKTFTITITNDTLSEQSETLVIEYGFKLNRFTVSFDANGGSVDTQSKTVSYGSTYGALPAPTRPGYTFKGWNGKNMFDISTIENTDYVKLDNNTITFDGSSVQNNISSSIKFQKHLNGHYVEDLCGFSLNTSNPICTFEKDLSFNQILMKENTSKADPWFYMNGLDLVDGIQYTISFNINSYDSQNAQAIVSNILFEKGNLATAYEPYYITSSTTVVQPNNHTLTAIWEPNTYDVFYQGVGGTQLKNSNLVAKYDGYYNNIYEHNNDINTWKDFSGNGHNGTISGNVSWGGDYINLNGGGVFLGQMNSDYATLEVTFSQDMVQSSGEKGLIANWDGYGIGIGLTNGYISSSIKLSNTSDYIDVNSNIRVESEKKYHVALTFDGTSIKLYVNGMLSNSVNNLNGTIGIPINSTAMAIGVNPTGSNGFNSNTQFIGKIYNAAIYNTALSAEQIALDAGKTVTYDSVYGSLPTPTSIKDGYTFGGWYLDSNFTTRVTDTTNVSTANNHFLYAKWNHYKEEYSTPNSYEFTVPYSGIYKVELWGASSGFGNGTYTKGNITLNSGTELFFYVGQYVYSDTSCNEVVFNGGGANVFFNRYCRGRAAGGATDVRSVDGNWDDFNSLKSRIMVAAGAGFGTNAGGLVGYNGWSGESNYRGGTGATQTSGGISENTTNGKFGIGATGVPTSSTDTAGSGGGGYYGGGAGYAYDLGSTGGSGSSFISGYSGCNAIDETSTENNIIHTNQPNHYSGKVFTNAVMIDGAGCDWSTGAASSNCTGQIQPDGTTATGHTGNGYARITFIE